MKDTLRTRLEFMWAKLAGREVDINTLTPKAPTNMIEKLMLEVAAKRDATVNALKRLVVALGGANDPSEVDGSNVDEVIDVLVENPPSSGGGLVINVAFEYSGERWVFDKTWKEIHDAFIAGKPCHIVAESDEYTSHFYMAVLELYIDSNSQYYVTFRTHLHQNGFRNAIASAEDDYPIIDF